MLPGRGPDQTARLYCPQCADERQFERPECRDGHGADCPERACVECGTAVLLAPLTQEDTPRTELAAPRELWPAAPRAHVVRAAFPAPAPRRGDALGAEPRRAAAPGQTERSPA